MEMNYCRRCGTQLTHTEGPAYKCAEGHNIFAKSLPAVGVFFLTPQDEVILAVRGQEPRKGMLDSVGGFVDPGETFEESAVREVQEELSLEASDYEPLEYLTSGTGNYPYQDEPLQILSVFFWTRLKTEQALAPADDVADIATVPLHEINMAQLHDDDIRVGIRALQAKFPKEEA